MQVFSFAQCLGYLAFVLGVTAFAQKIDRRLKFFNATECAAYAFHFALLGNPSASISATISAVRAALSLRIRAAWLAVILLAINLGFGYHFAAHHPAAWLPVAASCAGTIAMFFLRGIPMRVLLACASLCWLINNILSHSIGGTLLEACISTTNLVTILKLAFASSDSGKSEAQA